MADTTTDTSTSSGGDATTTTPASTSTTDTSTTTTATDTSSSSDTTTTHSITISGTPGVGEVGIDYSYAPTTTGDTVTGWAVTTGTLPDGLSLNPSTGAITGKPTAAGTTSVTLTATSANTTGTQTITLAVVAAVSLTPLVSHFDEVTGATLSMTPTSAANGTAPYTYTLDSGATGLSIDASTGKITGSVATAGSYTLKVGVTDSVGSTASFSASLSIIDQLTLSYPITSSDTVEVGEIISLSPKTSGGKTPLTYSVTTGTAPSGVTVDPSTGAIYGKLGTSTSFSFTVSVTDGEQTATYPVAATVASTKIVFGATGPLTFDIGGSIGVSLVAGGGVGTLTYSLSDGLPKGMSFNTSTAMLSGSPTEMVNGTVTLTATDSLGVSNSTPIDFTVIDTLALSGSTNSYYLTASAINFQPTVTGGASARTFSIKGSALPDGLSLDATTGAITGQLADPQTVSVSLSVTDGYVTKYLPLSFQFVAPLDIVSTIGNGELNKAYAASLVCSGGYGSRVINRISGALPAGVTETISSDGVVLSGVPTQLETTSLAYSVTDGTGSQTIKATIEIIDALTLDVSAAPTVVAINAAYSFAPAASGGQAPITLSYTGTLPRGITLDTTTGTFTGSTSVTGVFPLTVVATDSLGHTSSASMDITVVMPIQAAYATTVGYVGGQTSGTAPTITGGVGTRTFSVASNTPNPLPAGLSVNSSTGAISGTALTNGISEVWVVASDESGSNTAAAEIVIYPILSIEGVPAVGTTGNMYKFLPTITGGLSSKYVVSIMPELPTGLTLDASTGAITGATAEAVASSSYTMIVTDGIQTKSLNFQLKIIDPLTATDPQSVNGVYGNALSYQIQTSGADGNLTFVIQSGSLPNGLELDSVTGIISGTPQAIGAGSVYVRIDGPANSVVIGVTYNIATSLSMSGSAPTGYIQQAYTFTPTVTGGLPGKIYTLVEINPLPAGLSFSNTTGTISGTPTESCTRDLQISVGDGLSKATIDIRIVIMATGLTTVDGDTSTNEDVYVQSMCDDYSSTLAVARPTETMFIEALRCMLNATMAIYSYPTLNALNSMWALHIKYKNTLFLESNFFRGCEGISNVGITSLSELYVAYRAACAYPTIPYDFSYLDTRTGNTAISKFLKNKKTLMAKA